MRNVTREHKLALIVGFSLILLVGVLISDHVSSARRVPINQVSSEQATLTRTQIPAGPDLSKVLALPGSKSEPTLASATPAKAPAASITTPSSSPSSIPSATPPAGPAQSVTASADPAMPAPIKIANSPSAPGATIDKVLGAADRVKEQMRDGLQAAVEREGGSIESQGAGKPSLLRLPGPQPKTTQLAKADTKSGAKPDSKADTKAETKQVADAKKADAIPVETFKVHTVVRGDSLMEISKKHYGTESLWRRLAEFNNIRGGSVRIGQRIRVPSREALTGKAVADAASARQTPSDARNEPRGDAKPEAKADGKSDTRGKDEAKPKDGAKPKPTETGPTTRPRIELATYTVRRGDTLAEIAQRTMGSSKRWRELAEFNKLDDADDVPVGKVLRIPGRRG